MGLRGVTGNTLLAFVIAVSVTLVFVLAPATTAGPSLHVSENGTQSPAPSVNVSQTGSPPEDSGTFPEFVERTSEIGFNYEPTVPTVIEDVNSGVYVADINNNGYEDILAVGGEYPVLFRNTGGAFVRQRTFEQPQVQTAHFFDQDNDGDRDLLLAQYAGELLFYENDHGSFTRQDVGFDREVSNPSSIVSADFTGNGCLDVFITQYGLWSRTTPLTLPEAQRVRANHPDSRPESDNGKRNLLYYGDCESVTDATEQAGLHGQQWSLVSSAVDFTGDGYPDLHVGNDWSADYIYVNNGNGTFDRRAMGPSSDRNAMSSTVSDMNGDLVPDLFVTNIFYPENHTRTKRAPPLHRDAALPRGNNYFVNDGTGNFTDEASDHGLQRGGWGWTASIADFNNDGHLDIVQTTESIYWIEPFSGIYDSLQVWNGTAESWVKLESREYGLGQQNTYSIANVDYDNDGSLDIAVGTAPLGPNLRGEAQPFKIYDNQQNGDGSLQFFVRDPDSIERNAVVYVNTSERTIFRTINSGGNYQTQDSRLVHVGLENEELESVTVHWPDGNESVYTALESGNRYILTPTNVRRVTSAEVTGSG